MVPPETFLGKNIRDVMPPELAEKVQECVERLKDHDDTQILEYSLPLGDEERHFEARLVMAEGDKVLSIVRDVTQPYRSADALRKSQEQLLIRNRETRELAVRLMTAQESERRRIALLLHDDLSQNLAAMGIAISRLKRKPPDSNESLAAELEQLGKQTHELTSQIRTLSHQLHPDVLEHLVAEFSHNEHIKVGFTAEVKNEKIPQDVSACLYRVALEALRNVARHSGAAFANVALTEDAISFTLEVSDSGRGFDQEAAGRVSGLGLISVEERVRLLNGTFLVKSEPDGGTVLSARIPKAK
jgi:signal transduction histidine kinase